MRAARWALDQPGALRAGQRLAARTRRLHPPRCRARGGPGRDSRELPGRPPSRSATGGSGPAATKDAPVSASDRILARIRARRWPTSRAGPHRDAVPRDYLREHGVRDAGRDRRPARREPRGLPGDRCTACTDGRLAALLARLLADARRRVGRRAARAARRTGSPADRRRPGRTDRAACTPYELDAVDSVVTGCALAIAETGTIVLDGGPDQGRRRITLVPDHHICVVRVPEPGRRLRPAGAAAPGPDPAR